MYEPRIVTNSGVAGAAVQWNATLPMAERWHYASKGMGGTARFGPTAQESYERYREYYVDVTLLCKESEWPALEAQLVFAQKSSQAFTFRFDKNTPATEYSVYLQAPAMGEEIRPESAQGTVFAFAVKLTLRNAAGTPFDVKITTI